MTEEGGVVLVRQWRQPLGTFTLELPSGAVDAGEDPAEAAGRELEDVKLLIEKITALDGEPTPDVAEFGWNGDPRRAVDELIGHEEAAITALQAAIEPTGREGVSEALEHLLEHSILRKQRQVDFLLRARRTS